MFYSRVARLLEPTPAGTLSVVTIELMLDYLQIVTLLVLRGLRVPQAPTTTTTVDTTEADRPGSIASVLTLSRYLLSGPPFPITRSRRVFAELTWCPLPEIGEDGSHRIPASRAFDDLLWPRSGS